MGKSKETMDWIKKTAASAKESVCDAGKKAEHAVQEKEIEAQIWDCERKIKEIKEEWGVAAFEAHRSGDQATLQASLKNISSKLTLGLRSCTRGLSVWKSTKTRLRLKKKGSHLIETGATLKGEWGESFTGIVFDRGAIPVHLYMN